MDNKKQVSFAKKRKQSKVLAMLALSCMLAGAAACNDPFAGDGNYYVSAVDGEYVLTLADGQFALTIGNETKIGTYKYKGNDVELKFADKSVATAKVVNGQVTLSYNNATLSFIKQVDYNVSYSVDGAVANTVKVMNGKMASKPADPVKEGYSFVGWYADQACLTPYDFNTPVTGNTTIYGKFVEKHVGQDEYKATFVVDGNELSTKPTNNGVVYDLPTPTKEGATFAGWWMSDSQDANKLTCQYTGQTLQQNVKLYAVWESNAPLVSVTETGISWNAIGVNTSYNVAISYGGQQVRTQNTTATEFAFDFASRAAGEYTVTVTANGASTTVYLTNKVLDRVSNFVVNEGSVLVFNPVANAEKYIITVDCGNDAHTHEHYDNGKSTNFNFANCDMQEDGITFVVTAVANGYASSVSETYTYTRGLTALKGLAYDAENAMVTWGTVPNAASYLVEVTTANGTDKYTVYDKSFSVKNYTGAVSVKVSAVAFGYNPTSATVEFAIDKLPMPSGVTVDNTRVKWNAVSGAVKYNVMLDCTVYETTESWMTIPENLQVQGVNFEVSVQAVDVDGKTSYYSNPISVNYAELENVVYKDGMLRWDPVAGASSYEILLNGAFHKEVVGGGNATTINFNKAGDNKIVIKAKGTGVVLAQKEVSVTSREMIFDSRTTAGRVTQYKAVGDALEFPTFELAGYDFAGWYNVPGGAAANGSEFTGKVYDASLSILYANWSPKSYTVTLKVDGEVVDTQSVKYGQNYVLPSYGLSPTGLTFKGWEDEVGRLYTDAEGNCLNVWDTLEDQVLSAAWIQTFSAKKVSTPNGDGYEITKSDEIKELKEVTIPATYTDPTTNETLPVVSVAAYAFYGCANLETINLPDTVELIYVGAGGPTAVGSAFYGCLNLKNINIYESGKLTHDAYFSSVDGVLIRNGSPSGALEYGTELYYFPQGKIGAYTVPYGVSHIPQQTFQNSKITDITLPSTLSRIGMNAFKNSKLRVVNFATAEAGQTTADTLVLGDGAFRECRGLKSIQFPARLQETAFFDENIFREDDKLTHVDIVGTGGFYTSKDGLVCSADGREIVYCPLGREGEVRIPNTVERIGDGAFWKCYYITKVVIGPNVSYIGEDAFYGSRKIAAVEFLGTENSAPLEIATNAFGNCNMIRSVELPANLTKMQASAFGECSILETVKLNGGSNINYANGAFADASGVGYVKNIVIGENMGAFEIKGVFSGCPIEKITMTGTNANYSTDSYNILYNADKTEILYIPDVDLTDYKIPSTVTTIGAGIFEGNKKISAIEIGANVTKIGEGAFKNSSVTQVTFASRTADLEIAASAFENCGRATITIPETVTKIGSKAFAGCGFTTVNIPASVTDLALDAFSGCSSLSAFTVAANNTKFKAVSGILYEKNADDVVTAIAITPKVLSGALVLPNTLKAIPAHAFDGNTGITSITFEDNTCDSTLEIGEYAFANMSALKTLTFPAGLTRIPAYAAYMSKVTTVTVPNTVNRIGIAAFNNCSSLTSLTFTAGNESNILTLEAPEGGYTNSNSKTMGIFYKATLTTTGLCFPERLTELPSYSLANTSFTKLVLPSTISVINNYAVYNNTAVTTITFSKNTQGKRADLTLGAYAFAKCTAMASFTVPNSIKSYVGEVNTSLNGTGSVPINGAFFGWTKLATLTFEDGITNIGSGMFARTPTTLLHSLRIPDSVKTIGDYAFADQGLKNGLTIGSGVETIGVGAFIHIQATSITIPASVKEIKSYAFATFSSTQKTKYTTINFATTGAKLTTIGDYAFKGSALTSITLPTNTEVPEIKLGVSVFMNSTALQTATIPSNVKDLNGAFLGCTALSTLNYTAEGTTYDSNLKMLFAESGKKLVRYDGTATEVVIPDTVEVIANGAFMGAPSVTKVTLGSGVKVIETYAFASTNVATVDWGTNCGVTEIGDYAFYKTKLTSVTLPATLVKMGDHVFDGCTSLTSAEINGTNLGNYTFNGCTSLASVTLNDNTTHLGDSVFHTCSALTQIKLPTSLRSMGLRTFENTGLTSVTLPQYLTNDDVGETSVGYWFNGCRSLTSVTFECTNLNVLPANTFYNCKVLTSVDIPEGVTIVSNSAFSYCAELTTINFPSTLQKLYGLTLFSGCSKLETLDFSHTQLNELESHYGGASGNVFQSLAGLKTLKLPVTMTSLEYNVLSGSTNLETFSAPGLTVMNVRLYNFAKLTTVELSPELTVIGDQAFYGTTSLENFTFPDTLISIGSYAFCNSGINCDAIFTNGLTTIGDYAFYGTDITSVYLPESFEQLGAYVFYDCQNLSKIEVNDANMSYRSGEYGELYDDTNTLICFPMLATGDANGNVVFPAGTTLPSYSMVGTSVKSVTLPSDMTAIPDYLFTNSSIETMVIPEGVTSIGEEAFAGCTSLTSITLPSTLTEIKANAFAGCTSLTSITLPESLTTIGDGAFSGTGLTSVVIPEKVTALSASVFQGCSALTEITLPDGLNSIGSYAFAGTGFTTFTITANIERLGDYVFSGCTALTSAEFKGTNVGNYTFSGCTALTSVTFNNATTSIGDGLFQGCSLMTEVVLPANLTSLGNYTFAGTGFTSYVIPATVTTVGEGLFKGCTNLASVTLHDNITSIGSYAFQNCAKITAVTLPANLISMGLYAFAGTSIATVTLPSKLANSDATGKTAGYWFSGCTLLTNVTFECTSLGVLPVGAFDGCVLITTLNIPEGVTTVTAAFTDCTGLTTLTFPSTMTTLQGDNMFVTCTNLKHLDFSGTQLSAFKTASGSSNSKMFQNLTWLETLKLPETYKSSFAAGNITGTTNIKTFVLLSGSSATFSLTCFKNNTALETVVLGSKFTTISASTFEGCVSLKSVTFQGKVTSIKSKTFLGCVSLTEFVIPETVTKIEANAFEGCTSLTNLVIPSKVTSIAADAFKGWTSAQTIKVEHLTQAEAIAKYGANAFGNATVVYKQ